MNKTKTDLVSGAFFLVFRRDVSRSILWWFIPDKVLETESRHLNKWPSTESVINLTRNKETYNWSEEGSFQFIPACLKKMNRFPIQILYFPLLRNFS